MIFRADHVTAVLEGRKTQTRRLRRPGDQAVVVAGWPMVVSAAGRVRFRVGRSYAVQPSRGHPGVGRILLLAIRSERLQDLSPADAIAEGVANLNPVLAFAAVWDVINRRPADRWAANPPVWVLTFRRFDGPDVEVS